MAPSSQSLEPPQNPGRFKEVRGLMIWPLNSDKVKADERQPGHLYCESPRILFEEKGSEVIVGPKVSRPEKYIWSIRHKLTHFKLSNGRHASENTSVKLSAIKYR